MSQFVKGALKLGPAVAGVLFCTCVLPTPAIIRGDFHFLTQLLGNIVEMRIIVKQLTL